jgi:hypothetical protein
MAELFCTNEDNHARAVRAVVKLSWPDGRYKPETACAGCMRWSIANAREGVYPILIEPVQRS